MALSREEINRRYREKKTKSEGKVYYRRWATPKQAEQFDDVLAGESKIIKVKKNANT